MRHFHNIFSNLAHVFNPFAADNTILLRVSYRSNLLTLNKYYLVSDVRIVIDVMNDGTDFVIKKLLFLGEECPFHLKFSRRVAKL